MQTTLVNLIYTRISHDLSGAVGTVFNGTEMLLEMPDDTKDTITLIQNGATTLMARLKFFRQAFGKANSIGDDATADYLKTLAAPIQLTGTCTTALHKVLVMVLAEMLVRGGDIHVTEDTLTATGRVIKDITTLQAILDGKVTDVSADNSPALYAFILAQETHHRLCLSQKDSSLVLTIKQASE